MANESTPPPDDLKSKNPDDPSAVTEPVTAMNPLFHQILAGWLVVSAFVSIWMSIRIWPSDSQTGTGSSQKDTSQVTIERIDTLAHKAIADSVKKSSAVSQPDKCAPSGNAYLLISLFFGVLGGASHGLASLMDFRGQRRLFRSWTLWYFGRPILGGMLAIIFYVVFRAGLLSGNAASNSVNVYGIAAFSAMVGLFTDAATDKLSEVFKAMFTTSGKPKQGQLKP